jgi:hypothetical protein
MGLRQDIDGVARIARRAVGSRYLLFPHAVVLGVCLLAPGCNPPFPDRIPQGRLAWAGGTIRLARARSTPQTVVSTFDLSTGNSAIHEVPGEVGVEYQLSEYGTEGRLEEDRFVLDTIPTRVVRRFSRCGFTGKECISTDVHVLSNAFSFSPAADFVAFRGIVLRLDGALGDSGLFVKSLETGETRLVNTAGESSPRGPITGRPEFSWSLDGRTLCYSSDGGVFLVDAPSGRVVARHLGTHGRISPNGRFLAYVPPEQGRLILLERASGTAREVFSGAQVVSSSGWSASSEMVLFTVAKRPWALSLSPTSAIVYDLTNGRSYVVADLPPYGDPFRWIVDRFER